MISNETYEACLPVLQDETLEEEEKTDRLEELLRKETGLTGRSLQDAVLAALWRHRDSKAGTASPARPPTSRRNSPAPWQRVSTPLASPPLTGVSPANSALHRTLSQSMSPYTSPRPSPRLALAAPIPHSPSLHNYQFSEPSSHLHHPADDYGDFGSDTVDWLVNDDNAPSSRPSSAGTGSVAGSTLSATASAWISSTTAAQETQMSPYDMLRSVLGESKGDDEIEAALASNDYDLSATLVALMSQGGGGGGGGSVYDDASTGSPEIENKVLVGKSMLSTPPVSVRQPGGQSNSRSTVPCKYWLQTGECLRADCRFSHDLTGHVCKYWLMGNCLAGENCLFSHDPSALVGAMNINGEGSSSVGSAVGGPSFQVQDYDAFPSLQAGSSAWTTSGAGGSGVGGSASIGISSSLRGNAGTFTPSNRSFSGSFSSTRAFVGSPRSSSRPTSRHSSRPSTPSHLSFNDEEAFPSLGSSTGNVASLGSGIGMGSGKSGKKHHGKRGGHGHKAAAAAAAAAAAGIEPGSLADVVRMSPGPAPSLLRKGLLKSQRSSNNFPGIGGASSAGNNGTENGGSALSASTTAMGATDAAATTNATMTTSDATVAAAARAIPEPQHIPWLETGDRVNQDYIRARQDAFKHGGLRNKFLQSAAQAWNRNDARAAKALSLRGQSENELMRKAHREAARVLYESHGGGGGNSNSDSHGDSGKNNGTAAANGASGNASSAADNDELYVDLHGLHPEEAVEYLGQILAEQQQQQQQQHHSPSSTPPAHHVVYAITGTGHHSKNGKDKVGKAVRAWLLDCGHAFREFSVPGDRGNMGGILGIDTRKFGGSSAVTVAVSDGTGQEKGGPPAAARARGKDGDNENDHENNANDDEDDDDENGGSKNPRPAPVAWGQKSGGDKAEAKAASASAAATAVVV